MVSENSLREEARNLLGEYAPDDFPYGRIAEQLSAEEVKWDIRLSPYGFFMWAVDHYGYKSLWKNVAASQAVVGGYAADAAKLRDDMPVMLLNAREYVTKIFSNVADVDTCFRHLEGMTFPYVLYVLFAGSGQADMVSRYRAEMEEMIHRYPSTLDLLPESYRKTGEALNADAE